MNLGVGGSNSFGRATSMQAVRFTCVANDLLKKDIAILETGK
jgi:hypothetical protein